jgi:hypothetical protein
MKDNFQYIISDFVGAAGVTPIAVATSTPPRSTTPVLGGGLVLGGTSTPTLPPRSTTPVLGGGLSLPSGGGGALSPRGVGTGQIPYVAGSTASQDADVPLPPSYNISTTSSSGVVPPIIGGGFTPIGIGVPPIVIAEPYRSGGLPTGGGAPSGGGDEARTGDAGSGAGMSFMDDLKVHGLYYGLWIIVGGVTGYYLTNKYKPDYKVIGTIGGALTSAGLSWLYFNKLQSKPAPTPAALKKKK